MERMTYEGNVFFLEKVRPEGKEYRIEGFQASQEVLKVPGEVHGEPILEVDLREGEGGDLVKILKMPRQTQWLFCGGGDFPALSEVKVDEENTVYSGQGRFLLSGDGEELLCVFSGDEEDKIIVPDSVLFIGPQAFRGTKSLHIEIENPNAEISPDAFDGSAFLASQDPMVILGKTELFLLTRDVKRLILPEGLTKCHAHAFSRFCPDVMVAETLPPSSFF